MWLHEYDTKSGRHYKSDRFGVKQPGSCTQLRVSTKLATFAASILHIPLAGKLTGTLIIQIPPAQLGKTEGHIL